MPPKLTEQQNLDIAFGLAKGEPPYEISERVGCAPKTVYGRMADKEFMEQVEVLSARGFKDLPSKFRGAVIAAFETIVELSTKGKHESTRLSAARTLLEYGGVRPPKPEEGGVDDEPPVYAIRGDDGIYRPIVLLPAGKVKTA